MARINVGMTVVAQTQAAGEIKGTVSKVSPRRDSVYYTVKAKTKKLDENGQMLTISCDETHLIPERNIEKVVN